MRMLTCFPISHWTGRNVKAILAGWARRLAMSSADTSRRLRTRSASPRTAGHSGGTQLFQGWMYSVRAQRSRFFSTTSQPNWGSRISDHEEYGWPTCGYASCRNRISAWESDFAWALKIGTSAGRFEYVIAAVVSSLCSLECAPCRSASHRPYQARQLPLAFMYPSQSQWAGWGLLLSRDAGIWSTGGCNLGAVIWGPLPLANVDLARGVSGYSSAC